MLDLAQTLHEPEFNPDVIAQVFDGTAEFDEAYSDEHGIVCAF